VATLLSFSARWVRLLGKRYNEHGPDSLGDRRQGNGSAPAILTPEALSSLKERLKTPPDDGGLWTGPKVARGSRASIALKPCMISAAGTHWSPSGIPSRNQGRAIPTRQAKRSARRSKKTTRRRPRRNTKASGRRHRDLGDG